MKNKNMKPAALIAASMFAIGTSSGRDLKLAECPEAVRAVITANARDGKIDEVEHHAVDGKEIYIAEVDLPRDRDLKVYVSGGGTLLKTIEDIQLAEAPEAVRKAVQGLQGQVDDVDLETTGKKAIYHVEMDRHAAPDLDLVISADGEILSQTEDHD